MATLFRPRGLDELLPIGATYFDRSQTTEPICGQRDKFIYDLDTIPKILLSQIAMKVPVEVMTLRFPFDDERDL